MRKKFVLLALAVLAAATVSTSIVPAAAHATPVYTLGGTAQSPAEAPEDTPTPYSWHFFAYYDNYDTCYAMGVLFSNTAHWVGWTCIYNRDLDVWSLYYETWD